MKTSYEVLKEIESRIENLVRHYGWLNRQANSLKVKIPSIMQEIKSCNAQINCLKSLWAFIKGE